MHFIHISDVHLGVEPDAGQAHSKKRQQDIWDSFAEVVKKAGESNCQFLFISGDLFHKQPLKRELKEVNYLFSQIPQVKVILMAGNHDYMQPKSYYVDFEWAENVYFFEKEEVTCFDFPDENVAIYGLSYWHREIRERYYDKIEILDRKRINVLLAHGGDEKHIPFSAKQLLMQGFDYIAAGHIHKGGWLVENQAVMAGSLEPTDCNDIGPHGYWRGDLTKKADGKVGGFIGFLPIEKCEYRHEKIVVTPDMTQYELEAALEKVIKAGETHMRYRILLEGYVEPDMVFDLERLAKREQILEVRAQLMPNFNYARIVEEQPDSLLARYILRMQKHDVDDITERALEYGVNALLGHKICR